MFKIGLERHKTACRIVFSTLKPKFVELMIEDAQSEPQDDPFLQRVFQHYQTIKELEDALAQAIRETEAS